MAPVHGSGADASISDVIGRMQHIEETLPKTDGVACFNRMYLEVTQNVYAHLSQDFFSDPALMEFLDVVFADIYFAALDSPADRLPVVWQPLFNARSDSRIFPIQFAWAGMNAHINHDLPIAVVKACAQRGSSPDAIHADYQKVDTLLDSIEQAVRRSFESGLVLDADHAAQPLVDVVSNWSINSARDVAWGNALILWEFRNDATLEGAFLGGLARTVAMGSRWLLVPH